MKKILIDSDICLDTITGRLPYQNKANQVLEYVEEGGVAGLVSAESFSNMFCILRKLSTSEKAIKQMKNLRTIVKVGAVNRSTVDSALNSGWKDFEDALQHYCAIENECDALITRNTTDFKDSELPVLTPAEYIEKYIA